MPAYADAPNMLRDVARYHYVDYMHAHATLGKKHNRTGRILEEARCQYCVTARSKNAQAAKTQYIAEHVGGDAPFSLAADRAYRGRI